MEAYILDQIFEPLAIIDTFQSFIWTERYIGYGDFELYIPASSPIIEYVKLDRYISKKDSERLMIIESIELNADTENGAFYIISGRSLESILDRRIIRPSVDFTVKNFTIEQAIFEVVDRNAGPSATNNRKIPGLTLDTNSNFGTEKYNGYFLGDTLYNAVYELCSLADIGFKIVPNYETRGFVFSLYKGKDRAYDQEENPWVIFSPSYGNIISSRQLASTKAYKTVSYISSEDNPYSGEPISIEVDNGDPKTGLDRREIYLNGSSISRTDYNTGEDLTPEEFLSRLREEARQSLAEYQIEEVFEADVDATRQFVYGVDFFIGDTVQIVSGYRTDGKFRISEIMQVHDLSGESMTPTFISVE